MKDIEVQARLQAEVGLSPKAAAELTRKLRDQIHPVAAMATRLIGRATNTPGLGNAQAEQAAEYAKIGGTIGTAIPVIGTAIGTVIGAAAGMLIKKGNKTGRQDHANVVLNAMSQLPADYAGRQFSSDNFHDMMWTLFLTQHALPWGGTALRNHPSTMDSWGSLFIDTPKAMMQAGLASAIAAAAPQNAPAIVSPTLRAAIARAGGGGRLRGLGDVVGATVTVPVQGYNHESQGTYTFVNPGIDADPGTWARLFADMYHQVAAHYHPPSQAVLDQSAQDPYLIQFFTLLADYYRAMLAPQSLSTTLANAPVASVPTSIVAQGKQLASQYAGYDTTSPPILQPLPVISKVAPSIQAPSPPILDANGRPMAPALLQTPTQTALTPAQDTTAGMMYQNLASQGYPVQSPEMQQLLAEVSATGIDHTQAGPSSQAPLPSWAIPAGIGLVALLILQRRS